MPVLGVNIDHVATLRELRAVDYPSPLKAALLAQGAGAEWIVAHLREDRRHIQESDIFIIRKNVRNFNMEMAVTNEMVNIAAKVKPDQVTLVPEKRRELTTEGGLDVLKEMKRLKNVIKEFKEEGIVVSLFIDPCLSQVRAGRECLADAIEIHTGCYANANAPTGKELERIKNACKLGLELGLKVNAGHGLNYKNVQKISAIKGISELNIGHSIVSRAVIVGMRQAVSEMLGLIN